MSKFDQRVAEVVDTRIEDLRDLFLADDPEVLLQALRRTQDDLKSEHQKLMNLLQGLKDEVQKLEHRQEQKDEDEQKEKEEKQKEQVINKVKDTIKRILDSIYNTVTDALIPDSLTPFFNQIGSILGLPEVPTNVVELGTDILDPVIETLQNPIEAATKLADILYKMQIKSDLDSISNSLMATNAQMNKLRAAQEKGLSATKHVQDTLTECCTNMNEAITTSFAETNERINDLQTQAQENSVATQQLRDQMAQCCENMSNKLDKIPKVSSDPSTKGMLTDIKNTLNSLMIDQRFEKKDDVDTSTRYVDPLQLEYP